MIRAVEVGLVNWSDVVLHEIDGQEVLLRIIIGLPQFFLGFHNLSHWDSSEWNFAIGADPLEPPSYGWILQTSWPTTRTEWLLAKWIDLAQSVAHIWLLLRLVCRLILILLLYLRCYINWLGPINFILQVVVVSQVGVPHNLSFIPIGWITYIDLATILVLLISLTVLLRQ